MANLIHSARSAILKNCVQLLIKTWGEFLASPSTFISHLTGCTSVFGVMMERIGSLLPLGVQLECKCCCPPGLPAGVEGSSAHLTS